MKYLVLGGTGAIGVPLVKLLSKQSDCEILVTSRHEQKNTDHIKYVAGNAKSLEFIIPLIQGTRYDAIIDFMSYSSSEFKERIGILLDNTRQYVFFSSSRCFAQSDNKIIETSVRLVDECNDTTYLQTDEYALAKGREENELFKSHNRNWTIIRPYITYNDYRLQLGVYEKENWLKRMLDGKTVLFPSDIAGKKTSLTYAYDVAQVLLSIIGNEKAMGESYNITTEETHTWDEILWFYRMLVEKVKGEKPKVRYLDDSHELMKIWSAPWQIKYDRLFNREFDNSKIKAISNNYCFTSMFEGLGECFNRFISLPRWLTINWKYEGWSDRKAKELARITSIPGISNKIVYLKNRVFC